MVGLAPRAPGNCALSAPWGTSVRPLNFPVSGQRGASVASGAICIYTP